MATETATRVQDLIADDHNIVRDGLKRILAATPDLQVAAEASSGEEALAAVKANDYDVAMLDMSMPGLSGIDLIKRLKLKAEAQDPCALDARRERRRARLKAGAAGYLSKDSAAEVLLGALRKIAAGGVHIGDAAARLASGGRRPPHESLSDREFEVMRLLVEGLGPTEIGERHLSVKTVSTHKTRILDKLGLGSTAELVRRHGAPARLGTWNNRRAVCSPIWRKSGRLSQERLANPSMVKTLIYAAAMIAAAGH